MNKIAVYAGSFDPFTKGHLSIVKEASELFDHVYVVIARNAGKRRSVSPDEMQEAIAKTLKDERLLNCTATVLPEMLVADYCKACGAQYLVRGLRNTSDYMYEENIAKINREINSELKTIYFRADNEVISSSMVRELMSYGKDVNKYIPKAVATLLEGDENDYDC